jgi:hypothetical protein
MRTGNDDFMLVLHRMRGPRSRLTQLVLPGDIRTTCTRYTCKTDGRVGRDAHNPNVPYRYGRQRRKCRAPRGATSHLRGRQIGRAQSRCRLPVSVRIPKRCATSSTVRASPQCNTSQCAAKSGRGRRGSKLCIYCAMLIDFIAPLV